MIRAWTDIARNRIPWPSRAGLRGGRSRRRLADRRRRRGARPAASAPSTPAASAAPAASGVTAAPPASAAASTPSPAEQARRAPAWSASAPCVPSDPGDGLLVYYQAITHAGLGERDAALAELRSLLGRRLGHRADRRHRLRLALGRPGVPGRARAARCRGAAHRRRAGVVSPGRSAAGARGHRLGRGAPALPRRQHRPAQDRRRRPRRQDAASSPAPDDKLDTVLGLAVDGRRRLLYAVSTNGFEDSARIERRNARADLRPRPRPAGRPPRRGRGAAAQRRRHRRRRHGLRHRLGGRLDLPHAARRAAPDACSAPPGRHAAPTASRSRADGTVYVTLSTGIGRVDPARRQPASACRSPTAW